VRGYHPLLWIRIFGFSSGIASLVVVVVSDRIIFGTARAQDLLAAVRIALRDARTSCR